MRGSIAKGGSRFAFIGQGREYVLKTMSSIERGSLKAMYRSYAKEVSTRPLSLLPRFLVFCKVKCAVETVSVVLMCSVFSGCSQPPNIVLDLKGSFAKRYTMVPIMQERRKAGQKIGKRRSQKEYQRVDAAGCTHSWNTNPPGVCPACILLTSPEHTFLDADLEDSRAKLQLNVQPLVISSLLEHIRKDSELLAEHNLMDYSLLIGLVSKQHRCFGSKCVCTFGTNGRWVLNGNIVIGDTEVQLERCHCYTDECKVSKTNSEKKGKEKAGKKKHGAEKKHGDHKATKRQLAVFIGIIDVLQPYNTSKKV